MHPILRDADIAESQPKKKIRCRWVRYERTHSDHMWHTDYKQLDDGRWFLCYLDDAPRFVTAYGVFGEATTENTLAVLEGAIANHGKSVSIMTDHGSQFYVNGSNKKRKGASRFEEQLVELDIRQILARVRHPQMNGNLERLHEEIQRKLYRFEESSYDRTVRSGGSGSSHMSNPFNTELRKDPVGRFMEWYNYRRAHMSLDWENRETAAQAFIRKMTPKGETDVDQQTGRSTARDEQPREWK